MGKEKRPTRKMASLRFETGPDIRRLGTSNEYSARFGDEFGGASELSGQATGWFRPCANGDQRSPLQIRVFTETSGGLLFHQVQDGTGHGLYPGAQGRFGNRRP